MSGVRVLVGTRKGAFVLTSDGARAKWDVGRPALRRLGDLSPQGLAGRSRTASTPRSPAAGSARSSSDRTTAARRGTPVGNKFVYDGVAGTHQWYDGTPAPVGVQARLAPRAVARPIPTPSTPASRTRRSSASTDGGQTWQELPGLRGHGSGPHVAAGRRRPVPAHDPARSRATRSASSSRSPPPAPFAPTTAARRGSRSTAACKSEDIPDPDAEVGHCVHRIAHAPVASGRALHAEALGRDAQRRRRRLVARGQRQPADRLRLPDRRARARAGDDLRRADQERLRALSARRQAARLPQPDRRQRVGGADQRPAAEGLLRQRAARRDGGRLARSVRHLLRHDRRPGVRLGRTAATRGQPIVRDLPPVLSVEVQTLP